MQVKKFEGSTLKEALDACKRELGPEAVILNTKKTRRALGLVPSNGFEVTAAVSEQAIERKKIGERGISSEQLATLQALPAQKQREIIERRNEKFEARYKQNESTAQVNTRYADIQDEPKRPALAGIKEKFPFGKSKVKSEPSQNSMSLNSISALNAYGGSGGHVNFSSPVKTQEFDTAQFEEDLPKIKSEQRVETALDRSEEIAERSDQKSQSLSNAALELIEELMISGVSRKQSYELVSHAHFKASPLDKDSPDVLLELLAAEMLDLVKVKSIIHNEINHQRVIALVGPTGVGKTTTLAKIAGQFTKLGKKIAIITIDVEKLGAFEQAAGFARIFKSPFRSVSSKDDLEKAIADFSTLDIILIDTDGTAHKENEAIIRQKNLLMGIKNLEVGIVLPSTGRDLELLEIAKRYQSLNPSGLVFTKLDDALTFGTILNVSAKLDLPIHFFTNGKKVPGDLEEATRERIVSLVLNLE